MPGLPSSSGFSTGQLPPCFLSTSSPKKSSRVCVRPVTALECFVFGVSALQTPFVKVG